MLPGSLMVWIIEVVLDRLGHAVDVLFRRSDPELVVAECAKRLGLTVPAPHWAYPERSVTVSGRVDGQEVLLERRLSHGRRRHRETWSLRVTPPGGLPCRLQVSVEGVEIKMKKWFTGEDILTGDEPFDVRVFVMGSSEPAVIGLLNGRSRGLLSQMLADGWLLDGQSIRLDGFLIPDSAEDLERVVRRGIDLALWLLRPGTLEEHLIENVLCERPLGVRLRNLEILRRQPQTPEIEKTLRRLASDSAWGISVPAAEALGVEGLATLTAAVVNAPVEEAFRALRALEKMNTCPDAQAAVRGAVHHHKAGIAAVACEILGRWKDAESTENLCRLLLSSGYAFVRVAAASALGPIGGDRARAALLRTVGSAAVELKTAAIRGLGECGTVEDVPILCDAEASAVDARVRTAARSAIAAIQGRLGRVEQGWVSVAERGEQQGALSVEQEAARGSLSVSAPDQTTPEGPAGAGSVEPDRK